MKILTNPVLLRAAIVLAFSGFSFLLGIMFVRALRKKITEEADFSQGGATSIDTLPLNLYNTVIQQLKQQKHELQVQSRAEQNRARISENFSHAVLSNLTSGVLVFGGNGLVKTANPAAKAILGFASAVGMSAQDIFRGAASAGSTEAHIADEINAVLREGSKRRQAQTQYTTPAGQKRFLAVTISRVPAADGSMLGVTCLITDLSELETIRQQQQLHGEMSVEMALQLRTSLATISGYAQQLAANRDPGLTQQLATDIAQEASQLEREIGGFLTRNPTNRKATGAAAGK
ncbi:MAG TPA: PAS domain-containing protein [Candidatus Sulfotelmatobacter sp.]